MWNLTCELSSLSLVHHMKSSTFDLGQSALYGNGQQFIKWATKWKIYWQQRLSLHIINCLRNRHYWGHSGGFSGEEGKVQDTQVEEKENDNCVIFFLSLFLLLACPTFHPSTPKLTWALQFCLLWPTAPAEVQGFYILWVDFKRSVSF